ncbi:hypothetical protein JYP52_22110 [Nitratireductor aquibiodomus]|uniref:hypothetical protein n=1 Tax=Nitratireductor aquibiodomus TaxID=204799 RepID=UPI0019D40D14|nr:hypothetical protein [Nitratireductor aquibiodomus]MBN7763837.1 hypothetical protein [Nitratireductor aquibiodomus]
MSEENKSRLEGAIEQLRNHQTQLDADGIMVGVSREALDMALAALSAPKAEAVDPAAWQRRKLYDANGRIPQWDFCPASEATEHFEKTPGYEYRPLYTSPVPALTDEAVERAAKEFVKLLNADTRPKECARRILLTAFPSKGG